jgi:flagellum-specific peptidoglycan hydrolase FlgJ
LTRTEFIKAHALAATLASLGSPIFPETLLTQSIVESNNGNSSLSKDYNNYFGIKAGSSWKGKSVNKRTREVFNGRSTYINDNFRVYNSYFASARDAIKFYKKYSRYRFVTDSQDVEQQLRYIGMSGYATAPNYGSILISVYRANKDTMEKAIRRSRAFYYGAFLSTSLAAFYIIDPARFRRKFGAVKNYLKREL